MSMLLRVVGEQKKDSKLVIAGNRIEDAISQTTPRMKTMSAGRMGHSTTEVGDLVAECLV